MKIHSQYAGNILVNMCLVIGKMNGKCPELVIDSDERRAEKDYKSFNPTNKFPLLVTPEGNLQESHAIAKFLANGHASLLGTNAVERAQIDMWMNWLASGVQQAGFPAIYAILGRAEVTQAQFNDGVKSLKENLRSIDQALTGDWLVGSGPTVADIVLGATFSMAFQLILDQGFTKAAPKACAWFARVAAIPEFVSVFGKIKMAKKSLKPVLKSEEKPKKAAAAAAKPKEEQPKKEVNPLDALPPTNFDLFNFKTYFVNEPDKKGAAHDRMMAEVDREGFSFWFIHYEKFGAEGTVAYKFQNLIEGFMQRLEGSRKFSFGKVCMLGEEPNLEIKGVLLTRGLQIPQEWHDHPQFEYVQPRKLDYNNAADVTLIKEYFASKQGEMCDGLIAQIVAWHK